MWSKSSFRRWIANLRSPGRQPPRDRLRVEGLEDRAVPTTDLTASLDLAARLDAAGPLARAGYDLAYLAREYGAFTAAPATATFEPGNALLQVAGGSVVVNALPASDAAAMRADLERLGFRATAQSTWVVSGYLPIGSLDEAAALPSVRAISPGYRPLTSSGSALTQGHQAQRSDEAARFLGLDGAGVTVGVISDSYDALGGAAGDVRTGELPGPNNPDGHTAPVSVLSDWSGGTDEGRAMLQIVHDVAPAAALAFAAAGRTEAEFAQSIAALAAAGADVIVDDVHFLTEPMFQDGLAARAVDDVARLGVAYFAAAGNNARSSYEQAFRNSGVDLVGTGAGLIPGTETSTFVAHDFDPDPGVALYQTVTVPAGGVGLSFQWADPFFSLSGVGARSDLDLAVFDTAGNFLFGLFNRNTGADPVEATRFENPSGTPTRVRVAIGKFSGPDPARMKYVGFHPGFAVHEFPTDSGTVVGHANAAGAFTVGAAFYADTPEFGQDPPRAEAFTGVGGTPILFGPGGALLAVPEFREGPDAVAPDGVNTSFFGEPDPSDGLPNFFGTSAAAPHAAGVAALLLQASGSLSPPALYGHLKQTAIDMGPAGYDPQTGYGLIQAPAALFAAAGPFDVTFPGRTDGESMTVRRDTSGNVEFLSGAVLEFEIPLAEVRTIAVAGRGGVDTLTLDYTNGDPFPSGGLTFDGGHAARLQAVGYAVGAVTVTHTGADTGTLRVGASGRPVPFSGTASVTLIGAAADLAVLLPTGTRNGDVAVGDDGGLFDPHGPGPSVGYSGVGGSTFAFTRFFGPSNALTVTLGDLGNRVTVGPMDSAFAAGASVRLVGGAGSDTFDVTPQPAARVVVSGGSPAVPQWPGDALTYTTSATVTASGSGSGTISRAGAGDVAFDGIESLGGGSFTAVFPGTPTISAAGSGTPRVTVASAAAALTFAPGTSVSLTPTTGVANLAGDEDDTADTVVVVGTGPGALTASVNGSGPVWLGGLTALTVLGGRLADTLDLTPWAINAPQGWGVQVAFNDPSAAAGAGDPDVLVLHTVAAAPVSEWVVVEPAGRGAGQVVVANAADGSVIAVIPYTNVGDISVADTDGFATDTDSLTLRGTAGADTAVVGPDAAAVVSGPGGQLYRVRSAVGFATVVVDLLGGDDTADVTPSARVGVVVDGGTGSDSLTVRGSAGPDAFRVSLGGSSGVASLGAVGTAFAGVEAVRVDGGGGADSLSVPGSGANDQFTLTATANSGAGRVELNAAAVQFVGFGAGSSVALGGAGGDDTFTVTQAPGWAVTAVALDAGPPTASDGVAVIGTAGDDLFTWDPATATLTVRTGGVTTAYNLTGVEGVRVDGGGQVTGDRLVVIGPVPGSPAPGSGALPTSPPLAYQGIESFAVDQVPTAAADFAATAEDTPVGVGVLANDAGLGDGPLAVTIATPPAHGTAAVVGGTVVYTPAPNYAGPDSFAYRVTDADGQSSTATVTVSVGLVNDPPAAAADSYTVAAGTTLSVPAAGVLANDKDTEGDPLAAVVVSGPAHGTLALHPNGSFAYTPAPGFSGTDSFVYRAVDGKGGSATATVTLTVTGTTPPPRPRGIFATGAGAGGGPHVVVFDAATGGRLASFFAYDPEYRGGVRVAVGDVDGDGHLDVITGTGPGGAPHVKVFSGKDMTPLASFFAFGEGFRGGLSVAVGNFDADPEDEVVVGAGPGAGPHVRVFDVVHGGGVQVAGPLGSFFVYHESFSGGVNVAAGNFDGLPGDELFTGAASLGGPHVKVYSAAGGQLASFYAFGSSLLGVSVAAGDVDGDGKDEVITGPGDGGGPVVRVFRGGTAAPLSTSPAFDPEFRGGVWVGAADRDGDGKADLLVAPGQVARALQVFDGDTLSLIEQLNAYDLDFPGGVFVAGG